MSLVAICVFSAAGAQNVPDTATTRKQDSVQNLQEVVVTAYGIKKEAKCLGYSVQELNGDAVVKSRDANPMNALVGKVAGLTVGANPEMLGRLNTTNQLETSYIALPCSRNNCIRFIFYRA